MSEQSGTGSANRSRRLFDLRYLISGLFLVYGAIEVVTGLLDSDAELAKADGIRINLWLGIAMLVLGLVFLFWARLRPLRPADHDDGG
ncbi:hypothetical protein [Actinoallomurus iriomotensis]|uniref:Uncharacterized protein n=1 Tax=Actinoallomurus iriomotensis TaxID=478107 RepID=A0A9W6S8G9_9ACTN|nr:hypothetical protein [Actinoallomurus iriomotensis]GLY90285.1 hypothetical protein Airi02_082140 [Actinoallomurus iriomotensis]